MKIKEKIFYILILALVISCNEKQESKTDIKTIKSDSSNRTEKISESDNKTAKTESTELTESKIDLYKGILGEDISEISCYVKNIYRKNNLTFVEIDIVRVEITSEGERTIINENPKIRTYVVGINTIIYGFDCKSLDPEELAQMDKSLLKNKSIIVVGSSKDGVLESLNFGCYG